METERSEPMKKQWMLLWLLVAFATVSSAQTNQQQVPGPEQGGPSVNAPTNADPGQTAPDGSVNPSIKNPAQPGDSAPVGEAPTATGTSSGYGDTDTSKGTQDTSTPNMAPNSDTAADREQMSDADLQSAVRSKLSSDPAFANVQATVENGNVTLDGTVASKDDRKRLKNEIKGVSGVRKVKENVNVGSETQASPAASGSGPGMAFMNQDSMQSGSGSDQNTAGSTAGNSDTSANPSSQTPSTTAPQAGSMGAGQTGTTPSQNTGATIPQSDSATQTSSDDTLGLQRQIQSAITNDSSLAQSTVTVNVSDSTVGLEGTVSNQTAKMNAERIAQSYAGNRKVTNNLQVTGRGNSDLSPGESSMSNSGASSPSGSGTSSTTPDSSVSGSTTDQQTQPRPQQ